MDNKYYLFLDESGHHGLKTINQEFPIFVLMGCILQQDYFHKDFTKKFNNLKQKYFNTLDIIFHSRDIRKWQKDFKILGDPQLRHNFYKDLNAFISRAQFTIIAVAILKRKLIQVYGPQQDNPYDLCLAFILERTMFYLDNIHASKVKIVAEARGKKEDASLQKQYQLILAKGTHYIKSKELQNKIIDLDFVKKQENNLGTQLCDLVAYPLATKVLYAKRKNIAFEVIEPKMYRQFPDGDYLDYGLKIFP